MKKTKPEETKPTFYVVWIFEKKDGSTFEMKDSLIFTSKTVCKNYASSQTFNFNLKVKKYVIKEVVTQ